MSSSQRSVAQGKDWKAVISLAETHVGVCSVRVVMKRRFLLASDASHVGERFGEMSGQTS